MSSIAVQSQYPIFFDAAGQPLSNGSIYFGKLNSNPKITSNQVAVYWDGDFTQPAPQPIKTSGGAIHRNGTPANIYIKENFSIAIYDKLDKLVAYFPVGQQVLSGQNGSANIGFIQSGEGAVQRTLQDKGREIISPEDFGAIGDGIADDSTSLEIFFSFAFGLLPGCVGLSSGKKYRTTRTITLTGSGGNLIFSSSLISPDADVTPALKLGSASSILAESVITRLVVDRFNTNPTAETTGIEYVNVAGITATAIESRGSRYNHVLRPTSGCRVAYNIFENIKAAYGAYNLWFDQQGTGFANENTFFGGRLFTSSQTINNVHAPLFNQANTNRLYGLTLEGSGQRAIYCDSQDWTIDNCRTEGTWSVASIHLGPLSARCRVFAPRQDQKVISESRLNYIYSGLNSIQTQGNNGRPVMKYQRTGAGTVSPLASSSVTASTTTNSNVITVNDLSDMSLGDFISVAGGVSLARVEYINGLNVTIDTVAYATVSSGAVTRELPPVLDVSDEFPNSGNSFVQRLYAARAAATSYFTRAFSRGTEVFRVNTLGEGYFANGAQFGSLGAPLRSVFAVNGSLSFGSIAAGSSGEATISVTGATTSAGIAIASPGSTLAAGLSWSARVSGTDTVSVRIVNSTGGAITPATVNWRVSVLSF